MKGPSSIRQFDGREERDVEDAQGEGTCALSFLASGIEAEIVETLLRLRSRKPGTGGRRQFDIG
jgi:hypothetical protein